MRLLYFDLIARKKKANKQKTKNKKKKKKREECGPNLRSHSCIGAPLVFDISVHQQCMKSQSKIDGPFPISALAETTTLFKQRVREPGIC